jgi:hypothetical protein
MCLQFSLKIIEKISNENNIAVFKIYCFFASKKSATQLKSAIRILESSFIIQKQQSAHLMQIDIVSAT